MSGFEFFILINFVLLLSMIGIGISAKIKNLFSWKIFFLTYGIVFVMVNFAITLALIISI
jgi:hypothetical protein